MTTGIKPLNDRYFELISAFPPRPINDDAGLAAVQQQVNQLLDGGPIGKDEQDYLKVLGLLIYDYEEFHEPAFALTSTDR